MMNLKLIIVIVAVIIIVGYFGYPFFSPHIPDVKITSHSSTELTILKQMTGSIKIIVNNNENSTINNISVKTEIDKPDTKYLDVITDSIIIGELNAHQNSGDKYVKFKARNSTGEGIDFAGKIKVFVGDIMTNELPFSVRVE